MNAERIGDVWYTDDAEYGVSQTAPDTWVVRRGDGSWTECDSQESAEETAEELANGDLSDDDFVWND